MTPLFYKNSLMLCTGIALLSGCGGGENGTSLPTIKLSGPVSVALAGSDQAPLASDGTTGVGSLLSSFPQAAVDDFATRFPGVVAEEQFRIVTYSGGSVINEVFGIEGESADDTSEVEALYDADGSYSSSTTSSEANMLPASVSDSLSSLYPGAVIEEAEHRLADNGIMTYEVELQSSSAELEVLIDANGFVLVVAEELIESQVPAVVVNSARQELHGSEDIEFELVTDSLAGSTTYQVELEREEESVEIEYDEQGSIVSITFEQEI